VEIIPNSIDISRVIQLAHDDSPPELLQNKEFLLFFGRLEERKGVHVLAHALPTILKQFPHYFVVFVGKDLGYKGASMRDFILQKAGEEYKNQIVFFDELRQEELFPIVNLAKIVVLPSIWEAFGFVCIEAMALDRPVIATSGSGFEEIIDDNISGLLVEPGNSEALAQKIIRVIRDENSLKRISNGARERAKDFDVSKVAMRLLDYYERVRKEYLCKKSRKSS
jgi:glycosyltransferase involved in cell wall biosynthesis